MVAGTPFYSCTIHLQETDLGLRGAPPCVRPLARCTWRYRLHSQPIVSPLSDSVLCAHSCLLLSGCNSSCGVQCASVTRPELYTLPARGSRLARCPPPTPCPSTPHAIQCAPPPPAPFPHACEPPRALSVRRPRYMRAAKWCLWHDACHERLRRLATIDLGRRVTSRLIAVTEHAASATRNCAHTVSPIDGS